MWCISPYELGAAARAIATGTVGVQVTRRNVRWRVTLISTGLRVEASEKDRRNGHGTTSAKLTRNQTPEHRIQPDARSEWRQVVGHKPRPPAARRAVNVQRVLA